jgi:transcription elongation factor Elf1
VSRVASGQPVRSYLVILTCPWCEGQLTHVTCGTGGLDTRAIAHCDACRRDWSIVVTLYDVTDDLGRPRGQEDGAA